MGLRGKGNSRAVHYGRRLLWIGVLIVAACMTPNTLTVVAGGRTFQPQGSAPQETHPVWSESKVLRVCADPDNLPFSNLAETGFENRLAELIAADLGARLEYTWVDPQRRLARKLLKPGSCDVVLNLPAELPGTEATTPYYRSSFVFVTRRDRGLRLGSLDDPQLKRLRIGVQVVRGDSARNPAVAALARRGMVANVSGYGLQGDHSTSEPHADLLRAVARGELDVALVWGPLAGYYVTRLGTDLELQPLAPSSDPALSSEVAAGVRQGDTATRAMLERVFARRQDAIRRLLLEYGVPLLGGGELAARP